MFFKRSYTIDNLTAEQLDRIMKTLAGLPKVWTFTLSGSEFTEVSIGHELWPTQDGGTSVRYSIYFPGPTWDLVKRTLGDGETEAVLLSE